MRKRYLAAVIVAAIMIGTIACSPFSGQYRYTRTPYFEPTDPGRMQLLRHAPRRPHIQLGEVWIRPDPGMSPTYVENALRARAASLGADAVVIISDRYFNRHVVRHYWYGHRIYREREIVGVAIRYR